MNIYIYDEKKQINDDTCYIISKNGIFLKKKLELIESITPVSTISFLEKINPYAKLYIKKLPVKQFGSIIKFFKLVYSKFSSEAMVLLYYNNSSKKFKIKVPKQEVSSGSIKYENINSPKDYILIGTIHCHGSMSAFHSGIDVQDEKDFDGIHITIGHINDQSFSISASIVVNGFRTLVNPTNYINNLIEIDEIQSSNSNFFINNQFEKRKYTIPNMEQNLICDSNWINNVEIQKYDINIFPLWNKLFNNDNIICRKTFPPQVKNNKELNSQCSDCIYRKIAEDYIAEEMENELNVEYERSVVEDDLTRYERLSEEELLY